MSTTEPIEPTPPTVPAPTVNAVGVEVIREAYEYASREVITARRQHFEASEKEVRAAEWLRQMEERRTQLRAALEAVQGSPLEPQLDLFEQVGA